MITSFHDESDNRKLVNDVQEVVNYDCIHFCHFFGFVKIDITITHIM
jgi:hypothetical protein